MHVEAFTGPAAQLACEALGASAFVIRNLIMLADPSPQRDLLVHELTHISRWASAARRPGSRSAPCGSARSATPPRSKRASTAAVPGRVRWRRRPPRSSADVDTIHRSGRRRRRPTPDPAADPAATPDQRIAYFVANAPIKSFPLDANGEKVYAFHGPGVRASLRAVEPGAVEALDYAAIVAKSGLPVVGDSTHTSDIAKMKSEGSYPPLATVTANTYAFIKDGPFVEEVTDIRPGARAEVDPSVQFSCYLNVITKLKAKAAPSRSRGRVAPKRSPPRSGRSCPRKPPTIAGGCGLRWSPATRPRRMAAGRSSTTR